MLGLIVAAVGLSACGVGDRVASRLERTPALVRPILPAVLRYFEKTHGYPGWGPVFCGIRYLGGSPAGRRFTLYVWDDCEQYRARHRRLVLGEGDSGPAAVTFAAHGGRYRVVTDVEPAALFVPGWASEFPDSQVRAEIRFFSSGGAAMYYTNLRRAERELLRPKADARR